MGINRLNTKMDKYEQISIVGEGSYGLVMKCRHKETDQMVAIKKFLETEDDLTVRRMALREIRMLKRMKHENLVTMIEVFRYRKRFYIVFDYLEKTILDELEKTPGGLAEDICRERIYQVTRAISYCHSNSIIHRDVKPENILVSSLGVVKLCDFGFARVVNISGEPCTEYVATRWYRAPELLVGESNYGAAVDVWAVGCLFVEIMTGDPLFPGDSDIDQLYLIVKMLGKPCCRHQQLMSKNSQLRGIIKSANSDSNCLQKHFPEFSLNALDFLASCIKMDPNHRSSTEELLRNNYFTHDRFPQRFLPCLREKVNAEFNNNPLLRKHKTEIIMSTDKNDEINKYRKSLQNDQLKWKISASEGGMKRKYSCDIISNDNQYHFNKASQKSNIPQKVTHNLLKQASKEKVNKETSTTEMKMLEKSMESLAKSSRPISAQKFSPLTLLPPSPPEFQSLQQNFSDYNNLHPNNISKDRAKKSPNLIQNTGNLTVNQMTLLNNPKSTFFKKLERNIVVDNMALNEDSLGSSRTWLNNFSTNTYKRKEAKIRNDDFTLPNLPGAIASPTKTKKKNAQDTDTPHSNEITPRIQSSTSQKLSPKNTTTFPLMITDIENLRGN